MSPSRIYLLYIYRLVGSLARDGAFIYTYTQSGLTVRVRTSDRGLCGYGYDSIDFRNRTNVVNKNFHSLFLSFVLQVLTADQNFIYPIEVIRHQRHHPQPNAKKNIIYKYAASCPLFLRAAARAKPTFLTLPSSTGSIFVATDRSFKNEPASTPPLASTRGMSSSHVGTDADSRCSSLTFVFVTSATRGDIELASSDSSRGSASDD